MMLLCPETVKSWNQIPQYEHLGAMKETSLFIKHVANATDNQHKVQ